MKPASVHNQLEGFFATGVSYRTAPVEVRERFVTAHANRLEVSRQLLSQSSLSELVLIWTCNRVEIYGVATELNGDVQSLFKCMAEQAPELSSHIYCYRGKQAVEHLFRVAGGLDSMVFGETQITGQVKEAYESARQAGLTGKVLNRVFQKALQTAKEIRTRTGIGHGSNSVGSVAVAHAEHVLKSKLNGCTVLLIGAGKMATNCLRHLRKKGVRSVLLANRSIDRAQEVVREFNAKVIPFERCMEGLREADIVISSTSSPGSIVHRRDVEPPMRERNGRPLVMIDIAVPRDIDPGVGDIEGVYLHDIDALEATVSRTQTRREQDLAFCESIIDQKINALVTALNKRSAPPRTGRGTAGGPQKKSATTPTSMTCPIYAPDMAEAV